ncbi:cyclic peptide export ABC transporter [Herbaspirillum lusitanum]|uniref:cyclic peptide export ABC transporter n=1 Tax=Herbaspirillum lusitanum TaxID=213312 RepID=UPI0022387428|nr:cyclic peptide export ABC transporter [Herbaspirillum lusitanum]MCW5298881.1 cyclic peptide export ABC transporter [Herbaspirillum lusitanum]
MRLTELLVRDARTSLQRLGLMALLAGAASTGILAIVNSAAASQTAHSNHLVAVALYGIALLVYIFSQRYVLQTTTDEVERIVDERRRSLIRKLADCELLGVEKIGHGAIFSAINADTQTISQTAGSLILGVQAVMMIFWTTIYIATLSLPALALVAVVLLIAARLYRKRGERAGIDLRRAHEEVVALHEMVEGLLAGFKEVKLSSRRAAELLQDAVMVSGRTAFFRSLAQRALGVNFVFSQVAIFILLGTLVFILPALSTSFADSTVKVLTAVLFLVGPVSGVISAAPQITVANAAAENLLKLEKLFDENVEKGIVADDMREAAAPVFSDFSTIDLRHLTFARGEGGERFVVGPIDLSIRRGETLFITGGNGSGKTTFIKMLTGLYPADSGEILVDGRLVGRADMQRYRDMFGAVFSDFHLFPTLYGVERIDRERAASLIDEMEVENKAHLDGRRFSTVDLSTGQRKRLALVATQLENPPIMVLDEWAADQDPHFRAKFYQLVLPRLRAAGITVIAITHDDKYFHHADRRLHLEDGRVTSISSKGAAT